MEDRTIDRISRAMAGTHSRRQTLKLLGGGIAGGALTAAGLAAAKDTVAQTGGNLPVPVTGTIGDSTEVLEGTLTVTRFVNQGGDLLATGTLTLGDIVDEVVSLLVNSATGTCEVLHLELGPLDLDLLGLVVHLDQVVLDITAESGSGKLLGNLLCAVSRILDGGGPLGALSGLLNRILSILG